MDANFKKRFASKVKEIRGRHTQAEFAVMVGVSQPAVTGWEKGTNLPSLDSLDSLAELAGVSPEIFLAALYGRASLSGTEITIASMGTKQIAYLLSKISDRLVAA